MTALLVNSFHFAFAQVIEPPPLDSKGRTGSEFSVTNETMIQLGREATVTGSDEAELNLYRYRLSSLKKWQAEIKKVCPNCTTSLDPSQDKLSMLVEFDTNRWIKIAADPWIFEITGSPLDLVDLKYYRNVLQSIIWDAAKSAAGLEPHFRVGGGHIHIEDVTFFRGDAKAYRNYVVLMANNPEIFMGPFGMEFLNAPPLALLSDDQRAKFAEVISEFDRNPTTIQELKAKIVEKVYTRPFFIKGNQEREPWKYYAVNHSHKHTTEKRGFRPQKNIDQHIRIVEFLMAARDYAVNQKEPVAYVNKNYRANAQVQTEFGMENHTHNVPAKQIESAFRSLILQLSLPWANYSSFILDSRNAVESERNLRKNYPFRARTCQGLFSGGK